MPQRPAQNKGGPAEVQIALVGAVIALLILLAAALVRVPAHPPFYDTISAAAEGQSGATP